MKEDRLLFGLAAVLAGIATLEFVLAFVYTPALFAVAVPFAVAAYLVWYHASGRLRDRVESGQAGSYRRTESETGGFGAGPRDTDTGRRVGVDADRDGTGPRDARGRRGARGRRTRGRRTGGRAGGTRAAGDTGPSAAEAYRVLGLDSDADAEAVREAYREKVKAVHPDRESGDEEEFKRVKEAYEVLDDRN